VVLEVVVVLLVVLEVVVVLLVVLEVVVVLLVVLEVVVVPGFLVAKKFMSKTTIAVTISMIATATTTVSRIPFFIV
jgi:hypothetical protein